MCHIPGIEGLHALRDSIGFIVKARLPIGRDGRNRPSLFPFGTATGRNAHAKSPYNAHAGVRSFMLFSPDTIGAYLDWRTQEVGIAAAASDDAALKAAYRGGDVYHALARLCGLTDDPDPMRWKKTDPDVRHRMKPLQLGINYGMGVPSLARGLDRHPLIASAIIERHRREYPRFWQWRENMVEDGHAGAQDRERIRLAAAHQHQPEHAHALQFPDAIRRRRNAAAGGLALCEAGIVPIMLIHDGILLEETDPERIEHAKEIMLQAGRDVCDGFEIGVDVDQLLKGGARYRDKRPMAKKMWATIMGALEAPSVPSRSGGCVMAAEYVIRKADASRWRRSRAAWHRNGASVRNHHIGCPLEWLKRVLPLVNSKEQLAVAIWLHRRRAVCRNELFTVPNQDLHACGISRKVKYRTLECLERAGAVGVIRDGKHALQVKILS